ncbi:PEP/pyruvate-binding domain-containing protein [Streptomyces mirabilis]
MTEILWIDGELTARPQVIGGKAWGLNRMRAHGLPVPPAFVLPIACCVDYHRVGRRLGPQLRDRIAGAMVRLEFSVGRRFGSARDPLLVSVRSGAAHSMPGMLDTVLDIGGTSRDAWQHLHEAIAAVFDSWNGPPARIYRQTHQLAGEGTAVIVQAMVAGDCGGASGSGIVCTHNPTTASTVPYGEWLPGRPGADLAAGRATPLPLRELERTLPTVHAELLAAIDLLERDAGKPQEIEFTVESGRLWLLQTRNTHVSAPAPGAQHRGATHDPRDRPLLRGIPASPGRGAGVAVSDIGTALRLGAAGQDVVLIRPTTDPSDIQAIIVARALVTELGGATSHAAVVSRELGRPCVVGCGQGSLTGLEDRMLLVDGEAGAVCEQTQRTRSPQED